MPFSRAGLSCAVLPLVIRPAPSSTLRCLETAWMLTGKGSASSLTVASPEDRRFRIARRVGSASAAKVLSSCAAVIVPPLNQMVEYRFAVGSRASHCRHRSRQGNTRQSRQGGTTMSQQPQTKDLPIDGLRADLAGTVIAPDDQPYDGARQVFFK